MKAASLSQRDKSLVLASIQGRLTFKGVAAQMRRLFGSGGLEQMDVMTAADEPRSSDDDSEHSAWLAYRKARKQKAPKTLSDRSRRPSYAPSGASDSPRLNSLNRRTGERN